MKPVRRQNDPTERRDLNSCRVVRLDKALLHATCVRSRGNRSETSVVTRVTRVRVTIFGRGNDMSAGMIYTHLTVLCV